MEDPSPHTPSPDDLSSRSAAAIGELQARAQAFITARREQVSRLEGEITAGLDSLAASLSEQQNSEAGSHDQIDSPQAEINAMRVELEQAQAAWREERDSEQAALATRWQQLDERAARLAARDEELRGRDAELGTRERELARRREELGELERSLQSSQSQHENDRQDFAQCDAAWIEEKPKLEAERDELAEKLDQLALQHQSSHEEWKQRLAEVEQSLHEQQTAWNQERAELESARETAEKTAAAAAGDRDELNQKLKSALADASQREADWVEEKSKLEAERCDLAQRLDLLTAEHQSSQEESARRIAEMEQKLRDGQDAWERERAELEAARTAAERVHAQLSEELASAQQKLEVADALADAADDRDELSQKFELALADVQRFRARVAELEQELARRPEVGAADSAELVHLRAEREALAARVEELERTATARVDTDEAGHIADLQRRFELAVEDVRELKTKNLELESMLALAKQQPGESADSGGMDWESQKRRLLASLEEEGGDVEPHRQTERATIENTIEITDSIVAEKEREIEELKARLASGGASSAADEERQETIEKMLDSDEVIAQHRQRVAELEKQLEDKLRAAELELSVERAKIAREQAEIEEWRDELEKLRSSREAGDASPSTDAPRRRWLAKLGLSGDENG